MKAKLMAFFFTLLAWCAPLVAQSVSADFADEVVLTEDPAELSRMIAEFSAMEKSHADQMAQTFQKDPVAALKRFKDLCDQELRALEPLLASAEKVYAEISSDLEKSGKGQPAQADDTKERLRSSAKLSNMLGTKLSPASRRMLARSLKLRASKAASWINNADTALETVHWARDKIATLRELKSLSAIHQVKAALAKIDLEFDESPIVAAFNEWVEKIGMADADLINADPLQIGEDSDKRSLDDLGKRDFRTFTY